MEKQATGIGRLVTPDMLKHLPQSVQRYLTYAGVVGKPWIDTVRVEYRGRFRLAPDRPWMSLVAHQVYTTNPPGFMWKARFNMMGLPLLFGTDIYKAGHSHMHGTLAGLFTVVDGRGEEVDQGSMVRYLQEMAWFPVAYLGQNISWQAVDDHAADVTFHDFGKSVSGRMYFDDAGRLLSFSAQRYGEFNGRQAINTWTTPVMEYGCFAGLNLPSGGLGVWQLPSGDFSYIDVRTTEVAYNESIEAF